MTLSVGNNNSGMPYIPLNEGTINPDSQLINETTKNEQSVQGKNCSTLPSPFAMIAANAASPPEVLLKEAELKEKVLADPEVQQELKAIDDHPNYTTEQKEMLKGMLIQEKVMEAELKEKVLADPEVQQELKAIDDHPNYTTEQKEMLKGMLIQEKVMELYDIQIENLKNSHEDMISKGKTASRDMTG